MIQNAIPDFESFGRNVINKTKERYALVIHEINREIKAIKAKEKEERKELQRAQEQKGKARSRSQTSSSDEDSSSSGSSAGSKNKTNSMQFSGGEASSERSKTSSIIRSRKMDN